MNKHLSKSLKTFLTFLDSFAVSIEMKFHFIGNLWTESAKDKFCIDHTSFNVSSQVECQHICKERSDCVGYSYSKKLGSTEYCLICKNRNLSVASNNFGFYKRQGTTRLLSINRFYLYYIASYTWVTVQNVLFDQF